MQEKQEHCLLRFSKRHEEKMGFYSLLLGSMTLMLGMGAFIEATTDSDDPVDDDMSGRLDDADDSNRDEDLTLPGYLLLSSVFFLSCGLVCINKRLISSVQPKLSTLCFSTAVHPELMSEASSEPRAGNSSGDIEDPEAGLEEGADIARQGTSRPI